MPTLTAVAVAPPPGRILPAAFPASCVQATVNQLLTCKAMRSSSHRQIRLPASLSGASAAQYHVSCVSDRHDEKTATRLGSNRYSETPVTSSTSPGRAYCLDTVRPNGREAGTAG